jgi:hypothetical protein
MALKQKTVVLGGSFTGQVENWGRPLGGTDILLERPGSGFKVPSIGPAWREWETLVRGSDREQSHINSKLAK